MKKRMYVFLFVLILIAPLMMSAQELVLEDYSHSGSKYLNALVNKDSQLNLQIESGKFSKGDNKTIDGINWVPGISNFITSDKSIVFIDVHKKLAPMPKSLLEARGLITADYQNYLEKEWLTGLKDKYPVKVNQDVFSTIK